MRNLHHIKLPRIKIPKIVIGIKDTKKEKYQWYFSLQLKEPLT